MQSIGGAFGLCPRHGLLFHRLGKSSRRYVRYAWGAGETFPRTLCGHQVNTTLSNRSWLWEGLATELFREERTLGWSGDGASQVASQVALTGVRR